MMELAKFYSGWTLEYIRSLTMYELTMARDYMNHYHKNQGGGQSPDGKRH